MKTLPLIVLILVVAAFACKRVVPEDTNLRSLVGAPGRPHQDSVVVKHDSAVVKHDSTAPKSDTTTVPTPPFPQHTIDSVNNSQGNPGGNTNPPSNPSNPGGAGGGTVTPTGPSCPILPIYGDTLIFQQPSGSDYIVQPVNNPGPGKYFAWPVGMVIDQNTGAINITQSQTGMRYILGFVPAGTHDTCLNKLIIAVPPIMIACMCLPTG